MYCTQYILPHVAVANGFNRCVGSLRPPVGGGPARPWVVARHAHRNAGTERVAGLEFSPGCSGGVWVPPEHFSRSLTEGFMSELLKIAGVQMDVRLGECDHNLSVMLDRLEQAARQGAGLVVFPECALTGYCFESLEEALPYGETVPGPSVEQFVAACERLRVTAVYGLLERVEDQLFNVCALIGPSGFVAAYRKIHLPYLGIDQFTTPGDRPFAVHEAGGVNIGMNICYDSSFPEAARSMALDGADVIVLPTNFPPGAECTACHVINARAMENGVFYLAVNRVGHERGFPFIGQSKICDVDGRTLAEAPEDEETIIYADIEIARARNKLRVRVPKKHEIHRFHDRRPEMYGRLTEPREA